MQGGDPPQFGLVAAIKHVPGSIFLAKGVEVARVQRNNRGARRTWPQVRDQRAVGERGEDAYPAIEANLSAGIEGRGHREETQVASIVVPV